MAVKFVDALEMENCKYTNPLTDEEKVAICELEELIDCEIKSASNCTIVKINLGVINKHFSGFGKQRQKKLKSELDRLYRNAGWEVEYDLDDGLDGPNMSGADFWVLNGGK